MHPTHAHILTIQHILIQSPQHFHSIVLSLRCLVEIANKYMPKVNSIMLTCSKWLRLAVWNGANDIICYEHKITFNKAFVGSELILKYTSFLKIFISIAVLHWASFSLIEMVEVLAKVDKRKNSPFIVRLLYTTVIVTRIFRNGTVHTYHMKRC